MKDWSPDHPKAKLMSRKRTDILVSAKAAFLDTGYGGTSMESIAKSANVSIMTLYRHARSKEELFAEVIGSACSPANDDERAELETIMTLPLGAALAESAVHMQDALLKPDNIALMRVVMTEATRFPHLAELAYAGFFVRFEGVAAWILSEMSPSSDLSGAERARLGRVFVDRIIGPDILRVLLGMPEPSALQRRGRAEQARDDVLKEIGGAARATPEVTRPIADGLAPEGGRPAE